MRRRLLRPILRIRPRQPFFQITEPIQIRISATLRIHHSIRRKGRFHKIRHAIPIAVDQSSRNRETVTRRLHRCLPLAPRHLRIVLHRRRTRQPRLKPSRRRPRAIPHPRKNLRIPRRPRKHRHHRRAIRPRWRRYLHLKPRRPQHAPERRQRHVRTNLIRQCKRRPCRRIP